MTQFNPNLPPPPPKDYEPGAKKPETNGLATGALICSLIICVPFVTPVIGAILGVVAIVMIAQSKGRQRGIGLAVAGIVISCVVFVGDIWATKYIGQKVGGAISTATSMFTQPAEDLIKSLQKPDYATAKSALVPEVASATTDDELKRLRKRITNTCGTLVDVKFDFMGRAYNMGLPGPAGGNPNAQPFNPNNPQISADEEFPAEFVFDQMSYYGIVTSRDLTLQNPNANVFALYKLTNMAIVTDDGIIYFPESSAPETTTDEESAAEEDAD